MGICAVYVIRKKYRFDSNPLNIGLVSLAIISFISGLLNKDAFSLGASAILLTYLSMNVWFKNNCLTYDKINDVLSKVWHLCIISGVIGIIEKIIASFWDITWYVKWFWNPTFFPDSSSYRILSTFGNPNIAGDWFAILILISFYFIDKEKDNLKQQFKYGVGGILFTANLILTGSKGALVSFVVAVIGYCLIKNSRKMWRYLIGIMIVIVAFFGHYIQLFQTMNFRNAIWLKCIDLIGKKPIFGWGFSGIFKEIGEVHGHNIWISITASLGFVGLIVFLIMSVYILDKSVVLIKSKISMSPLFVSVLLLLFIHGIVDFTILAPQTGIIFFATMQVVVQLAERVEQELPVKASASALKQHIAYMKFLLVYLLKIH